LCIVTKHFRTKKPCFWFKNTCFGSKNPVSNIPYIQNIQKWLISDTQNRYKNIANQSVLNFCKKLVPTWILIENSITISKCWALQIANSDVSKYQNKNYFIIQTTFRKINNCFRFRIDENQTKFLRKSYLCLFLGLPLCSL